MPMLTSGMDAAEKQEDNTLLISWCSLYKINFKMNLPKLINFYFDWRFIIITAKYENKSTAKIQNSHY
jgi:hypothetical protein